ncbi:hypothetical protein AAF712_010453 [Marasmius tenuissimus]|uniref:Uncharacterized protein n=1 Tax=Marasmius tenuissimus TaxID=585030 RepID=A0ABR2ZNC3_9AGAR
MLILRIFFCTLFAWLFSPFNPLAKVVTRYIDDSYGDLTTDFKPRYYPADSKVWQGQNCDSDQRCNIVFDTQQSHNGTYTAATYQTNMTNMGFSLWFQGTSISVYFILAGDDYVAGTITSTECDFILDGYLEKSYAWHEPLDQGTSEYNVEVFKKEGLKDRLHFLDVETGKKTYQVYIAFDYAIYTVEELDEDNPNRTDSSKDTPTGAIVGSAIGGLALTGGTLLVFFVYRKRRNGVAKHVDGSGTNIRVVRFMAHSKTLGSHQTGNTSNFRSGHNPVASAPRVVVAQVNSSIDITASHPVDSRHNAGDTTSGLEALSTGVDS